MGRVVLPPACGRSGQIRRGGRVGVGIGAGVRAFVLASLRSRENGVFLPTPKIDCPSSRASTAKEGRGGGGEGSRVPVYREWAVLRASPRNAAASRLAGTVSTLHPEGGDRWRVTQTRF